MPIRFERVELPRDRNRLVEFLIGDDWPFHGRPQQTVEAVDDMEFSHADVDSYWMIEDGTVGLIRLLDLGDIGQGAPQFDLRIASRSRGRGLGSAATTWIVGHLFETFPACHRIEANTRDDNAAMQGALAAAGFTLEGRLRSSWRSGDGTWFDTMVYGLLRTDGRRPLAEGR